MTWELLVFIGCCCTVYIYFRYFTATGVAYDLLTKPKVRKLYVKLLDKKLSKKLTARERKGCEKAKKILGEVEWIIKGEAVELETEIKRLIALGKTSAGTQRKEDK